MSVSQQLSKNDIARLQNASKDKLDASIAQQMFLSSENFTDMKYQFYRGFVRQAAQETVEHPLEDEINERGECITDRKYVSKNEQMNQQYLNYVSDRRQERLRLRARVFNIPLRVLNQE